MEISSKLRDAVREAYSAAADDPNREHPFPVGRSFAESLGYPRQLLDRIPPVAFEAFTGVSRVGILADLPDGATVLDLGCGSGLDSLVASERVGPGGSVLGVDFSSAMLERARRAAGESNAQNVTFVGADAERLPVADATIDVVLTNGIFNLNPAREAIFSEMARVLRRGAPAYAAELILREAAPARKTIDPSDWFA